MMLAFQNLHGWNSQGIKDSLATNIEDNFILLHNSCYESVNVNYTRFQKCMKKTLSDGAELSVLEIRGFFFSVYVSVCVHVAHTRAWCKHVGVPACVCARGDQKMTLGVFFDYSTPYCLRPGLLLTLSSQNGETSEVPGSHVFVSPHPVLELQVPSTTPGFLCGRWESKLRSLGFQRSPQKDTSPTEPIFSNLDYTFWKSKNRLG